MRMLDLFCGRWGWSKAFAARGWECVGVDLTVPPEMPKGCTFVQVDVLLLDADWVRDLKVDFICASSPCEQFSVHGMKNFHPNPKYPELGIKLFNHTRALCEASGLPYVMENVRAAQQFVGQAVNHCGPFYLWGNAVPPIMPQGIKKGMNRTWNPETRERSPEHKRQTTNMTYYPIMDMGNLKEILKMTREERRAYRKQFPMISAGSKFTWRKQCTAAAATIPPELAACVADYAERL